MRVPGLEIVSICCSGIAFEIRFSSFKNEDVRIGSTSFGVPTADGIGFGAPMADEIGLDSEIPSPMAESSSWQDFASLLNSRSMVDSVIPKWLFR